jgi:putative addiction module killer protein
VYPVRYIPPVLDVGQTIAYSDWFDSLRDRAAKVRKDIRIRRLSLGNPGDVKSIGEGVSELRVDYGPGYRIYFARRGEGRIILLVGGDKSSQDQDIRRAKALADNL